MWVGWLVGHTVLFVPRHPDNSWVLFSSYPTTQKIVGGVWTEQNSNIFWVVGYKQNKTQLFSGWRCMNRTVWPYVDPNISGWRGMNRTKLNYYLGGGVRTEQCPYVGWFITLFCSWHVGWFITLFCSWRGTNRTVWPYVDSNISESWGYEQNKTKLFSGWWGTFHLKAPSPLNSRVGTRIA